MPVCQLFSRGKGRQRRHIGETAYLHYQPGAKRHGHTTHGSTWVSVCTAMRKVGSAQLLLQMLQHKQNGSRRHIAVLAQHFTRGR